MVQTNIMNVTHAIHSVRDNDSFKMFLGLLLKLSNHLNSRREAKTNMHAFRIHSIVNTHGPVLQFLILEASETHPEAMTWVEDFRQIFEEIEVQHIDMDNVADELMDLRQRITDYNTEIAAFGRNDVLHRALGERIQKALRDVNALENSMRTL